MAAAAIDEPSIGKRIVREQDNDHWTACIPDAHPGYISWEQHQENLRILKSNICHKWNAAVASPPREGPALLQGRAVCGQCGRHFRMRYAARRGRQEAWYVCDRARSNRGEPLCQAIAAPPVDEAIGMLIAEQMTPAAIELAIEVRKEIEARHEEADRLRCRAIERAQTEADLAQRRFMLVDPNNRLVADTLEGEWNEKLRILANAREERERARENDQFILDKAIHERLVAMTADFKKLWTNPETPNRERKRLLAHIIEDVTLLKLPKRGTTKAHIRFKGGKTQTLVTMSPKSPSQQVKTNPDIIELIDTLLDNHIFSEIAEILNESKGARITGGPGCSFCYHPAAAEAWRQTRQRATDLGKKLITDARGSEACQILMSIPGIGAITATSYMAAIEDPNNLPKSRSVGAWLGLTTRRYQSGEVDYDGHISRRGDAHLRGLLYEEAVTLLARTQATSRLRDWGLKLRERVGFKRAAVAVARKLAVIMHAMLKSGELFNTAEIVTA